MSAGRDTTAGNDSLADSSESARPPVATGEGFGGKLAASVVGITYRQLDYWARTDLVTPSLTAATGSGSRRRYSYRDLLELKVVKDLLDAGIKLESVRQVFRYLRDELGGDIASANLVISGSTSVLVRTGEEVIDLLQNGQGVLNVLPLSTVKNQVDAAIFRLGAAAEAAIDSSATPTDADQIPEAR